MEENIASIQQELAALPSTGSAFGEAWDTWQNQSDSLKSKMNDPSAQPEDLQIKDPQPTEKPAEPKHQSLEISDDPFGDILSDKPKEQAVATEDEPDFDKELNEKFKDEPADAKGKARWGEIKGELKSVKQSQYQLQRSLALKEKEIAELKANQPVASDEYKAKFEELLKSNPVLALQADQDFQEKIAKPYQQANGFVQAAVNHFGIDMKALQEAAQEENTFLRNRKLAEVYEAAKNGELLPEERSQLTAAIAQAQAFESKYYEAQDKAVELYEASRQKQAEAQIRTSEEKVKQLLEVEEEVFNRLTANKQFKEIFNGNAADLRAKVKGTLAKDSDPKIAVLEKFASFAFKPLMTSLEAKDRKIAELEQALAKYHTGGATAGAGAAAPISPSSSQREDLNQGEYLEQALQQAQGGKTWTRSKF